MTNYRDLGSVYDYPNDKYQPMFCYIPETNEIVEYHWMFYSITDEQVVAKKLRFVGKGYPCYTAIRDRITCAVVDWERGEALFFADMSLDKYLRKS